MLFDFLDFVLGACEQEDGSLRAGGWEPTNRRIGDYNQEGRSLLSVCEPMISRMGVSQKISEHPTKSHNILHKH